MDPSLEKCPLVQAAATSVLRSPELLHMGNPKPETPKSETRNPMCAAGAVREIPEVVLLGCSAHKLLGSRELIIISIVVPIIHFPIECGNG